MKTGGANNLIIDGNNLLYRIFWTSNYKIEESNNPGQVFLFLRSLKSYVDKFRPKNIYCTWDKKLEWPSTNFRREATTVEYKAGRDDEKFKNVFENAEKIQELLTNLGVHNIYPLRMEADDLMAWLSEELSGTSVIVTTDKDLLQTVTERTIVYSPIKKKEITLDNFEEYTGVKKEHYISFRAVTGDKSDNIPGIPRYGIKRFLKLEHRVVSIDNSEPMALVRVDELTNEQYEIYSRNWLLMDLKKGYNYYDDEVPAYEKQLKQLQKCKINFSKFLDQAKELNLWSIVRNYTSWRNSFDNNENLLNTINKAIQNAST
jgi:DNA polymerase-1